jgi:hypothetical protein
MIMGNWAEAKMATYSVKLVDNRNSSPHEMQVIRDEVARVLGLAFVGTSNSVNVAWGNGTQADSYVIHFVQSKDDSYLKKQWPDFPININPNAGGHTHSHLSMSGTEMYRVRVSGSLGLKQYGFIAFHEALHNLFPWRTYDPIKKEGPLATMGGGLAAETFHNADPNEDNKEWLRRGFSVPNPQLLKKQDGVRPDAASSGGSVAIA